jgi:hypothetical protein
MLEVLDFKPLYFAQLLWHGYSTLKKGAFKVPRDPILRSAQPRKNSTDFS